MNQDRINKFVQSVYLVRYGRYIDDLADADGVIEVAKTIDWTNQFLDELEEEADWNFVRDNDRELGIVSSDAQTFPLEDDVRKLIVDENRPLKLVFDGTVVGSFDVVNPNHITRNDGSTGDRVTVVNRTIIFSRKLRPYEIGSTVMADVINYIPRLSSNDIAVLDLVTPKQLLILGVAKNATLPDIVQGGLSPSFVQKYGDLLEKAREQNEASSVASSVIYEDLGYIGGTY